MIKKTIRIDSRLKEDLNDLASWLNCPLNIVVNSFIELFLDRAPLDDLIHGYNASALQILKNENHPNRLNYNEDFFSNNLFNFELKDCQFLEQDCNLTIRLAPDLYDAVVELSKVNSISFSNQILVILQDDYYSSVRIKNHIEVINYTYDFVIKDWLEIDDEQVNTINSQYCKIIAVLDSY